MIKKILAAVDFSECAAAALARARELVQQTGAELVLVYANELPVPPVGDPTLMPAYVIDEGIARGKARFAQLVEETQREVPARGFTEVGPAHQVISAAIAREHPDLVITGTHGRSGLGRMFLGSFTERLVRTSPVPVLTVRAAKTESKS